MQTFTNKGFTLNMSYTVMLNIKITFNKKREGYMKIVPFYAAILALLFIFLTIRIIKLRRSFKITIGDNGNMKILRAVRTQANFAEYVPLCLILLGFIEMQNGNNIMLHTLCSLLVVARFSHAYGISQENENFKLRVLGMALTFTAILTCSFYILASLLLAIA